MSTVDWSITRAYKSMHPACSYVTSWRIFTLLCICQTQKISKYVRTYTEKEKTKFMRKKLKVCMNTENLTTQQIILRNLIFLLYDDHVTCLPCVLHLLIRSTRSFVFFYVISNLCLHGNGQVASHTDK